MTQDRRLRDLLALADLRADRSAALLAQAQAVVDELRRRQHALRYGSRPSDLPLEQMIIRDKHDQWRAGQLSRLALALDKAEAQAQPFRLAYGRDRARASVLERLANRSKKT